MTTANDDQSENTKNQSIVQISEGRTIVIMLLAPVVLCVASYLTGWWAATIIRSHFNEETITTPPWEIAGAYILPLVIIVAIALALATISILFEAKQWHPRLKLIVWGVSGGICLIIAPIIADNLTQNFMPPDTFQKNLKNWIGIASFLIVALATFVGFLVSFPWGRRKFEFLTKPIWSWALSLSGISCKWQRFVISDPDVQDMCNERKKVTKNDRIVLDKKLRGIKDLSGINFSNINNKEFFKEMDLSELNLAGSDFSGMFLDKVKFINANLTGAKFIDATLTKVNLTRSNVADTDFTGARLTGICIQDLSFTKSTKLDGVVCKHVFLQQEEDDDGYRDRCPNRTHDFEDGEFTKICYELLNRTEVSFRVGIGTDLNIAVFTTYEAMKKYPNARIMGSSLTGDFFNLIFGSSDSSDKDTTRRIKQQIDTDYQVISNLIEEKQIELRKISGDIIDVLIDDNALRNKELIEILKNLDKQYLNKIEKVETKLEKIEPIYEMLLRINEKDEKLLHRILGILENHSKQSTNMNVNNVNQSPAAIAAGGSVIGNVIRDVRVSINALPSSTDPNKKGIRELLEELEGKINSSADLPSSAKEEALEKLTIFAQSWQQPETPERKSSLKGAFTFIKGVISDCASLFADCKEVFAQIGSLFGG